MVPLASTRLLRQLFFGQDLQRGESMDNAIALAEQFGLCPTWRRRRVHGRSHTLQTKASNMFIVNPRACLLW